MINWRLCFITSLGGDSPGTGINTVTAACAAGLRAVQLRDPDRTTREMFDYASALRDVTWRTGAALLINDRIDIALAVEADGLHAPERDATTLVPLAPRFMSGIIGVSCHSLLAAVEAEAAGVDYVMFGPIFDTPTKRRYGPPQGLDKLARVVEAVDIPVVAVGGITPQFAQQCRQAGAAAVAAISSIAGASDVMRRVTEFGEAMGEL